MALINNPPVGLIADDQGNVSQPWLQFFSGLGNIAQAITLSGTTAKRPVEYLWVGRPFFDTTLGKPIWFKSFNPNVWVDATGAPV